MQQANSFSGSHALVLSGVQKWADAAPRSWSTGRAYSFLSCWPRTRSLQIRAKQIKELDSERNETLKASHCGQLSEGLATDEKPARVIVYITSPRPTVWRSGAIPSSGTEGPAGNLVISLACSWCLERPLLGSGGHQSMRSRERVSVPLLRTSNQRRHAAEVQQVGRPILRLWSGPVRGSPGAQLRGRASIDLR